MSPWFLQDAPAGLQVVLEAAAGLFPRSSRVRDQDASELSTLYDAFANYDGIEDSLEVQQRATAIKSVKHRCEASADAQDGRGDLMQVANEVRKLVNNA